MKKFLKSKFYLASSNSAQNSLPAPASLFTPSFAPWILAIFAAMASPRPLPVLHFYFLSYLLDKIYSRLARYLFSRCRLRRLLQIRLPAFLKRLNLARSLLRQILVHCLKSYPPTLISSAHRPIFQPLVRSRS